MASVPTDSPALRWSPFTRSALGQAGIGLAATLSVFGGIVRLVNGRGRSHLRLGLWGWLILGLFYCTVVLCVLMLAVAIAAIPAAYALVALLIGGASAGSDRIRRLGRAPSDV